jgi:hypothetical protein
MPNNLLPHKKQGQQKIINDPIDDLVDGPIGEVQCYHNFANASHIFLFLINLLSLPHLHVRKTKDGEPLVEYSQLQYVVTSNEYA